jgi:hypothetical protein
LLDGPSRSLGEGWLDRDECLLPRRPRHAGRALSRRPLSYGRPAR